MSRAPRKTLSDEQIKAAATVSKSGAGIWLLSHAEEMLIGVVSFAAGCLVMIAVLHHTAPKPSGPQTSTIKTELQDHNDDNDIQNVSISTSNVSNPTSHVSNPMSHVKSPTSHVQSPTSQEPVVVKEMLVDPDIKWRPRLKELSTELYPVTGEAISDFMTLQEDILHIEITRTRYSEYRRTLGLKLQFVTVFAQVIPVTVTLRFADG